MDDWPALRKWSTPERFAAAAAEGLAGGGGHEMTLHGGGLSFSVAEYANYAREACHDDLPLYIFDRCVGWGWVGWWAGIVDAPPIQTMSQRWTDAITARTTLHYTQPVRGQVARAGRRLRALPAALLPAGGSFDGGFEVGLGVSGSKPGSRVGYATLHFAIRTGRGPLQPAGAGARRQAGAGARAAGPPMDHLGAARLGQHLPQGPQRHLGLERRHQGHQGGWMLSVGGRREWLWGAVV